MSKIHIFITCLSFHIIAQTQSLGLSEDMERLSTGIATDTLIDCKKIWQGFEPKKPDTITAKDVEDYLVKGICMPEDMRCINSEEIAHKVAGILSACRPNQEIPQRPIERQFLDRELLR